MIPQIIQLGPFPINSFGLMIALALLACTWRLAISFRALGIDSALAERYVFVAGFSGLAGARIWYLTENLTETLRDPMGALFSSAGFTFYGGLIISFLVMWWMCRRDKVSFTRYLDASGPTMTLGYAIGRVGCQLSGDGDYGVATTSIFGMSYASGVVPTPPGVLAFPTPLYETTIALLILPILMRVEVSPAWQAPLKRFGLYLVLISIERVVIEFLRINPKMLGPLSEAQLIGIGFALIGVFLVFRRPSRDPIAGTIPSN